jgi:Galactose oxidase, central domain
MRLNSALRLPLRFVHVSLSFVVFVVALSGLFSLHSQASTPTWKRFGALQQARHSFAVHPIAAGRAIIVGGYVNASSGVYSGTPTASCEILNADDRTITAAPVMSDARAEFASVQMPDGSIVVVSGNSRGGLTASVEVYSPATNAWRKVGNLLIARRQHTACFVNNDEILVVGGRLANLNTIAAAEIFNSPYAVGLKTELQGLKQLQFFEGLL